MLKKSTILILCILLAVSVVFTGCVVKDSGTTGTNKEDRKEITVKTSDTSAKKKTTPGYTLPLTTKGETLRVATKDATLTYDTPNDITYQDFESITGVKIIWDLVAPGDWETHITARFASGADLPDITKLAQKANIMQLASEGAIIPLNDLIMNFAPNIQAVYKEMSAYKGIVYAPDGKIYTVDRLEEPSVNAVNPAALLVRMDWLKKLDLPVPETIEDWYTMLKAFKDRDPNGNSQKDEIPYNSKPASLPFFATAFGIHARSSDGFYPDANGKIEYEWITSKAKDYFTMMNKWYNEGLMDQECYNKWNGDKFEQQKKNNQVGVIRDYLLSGPDLNKNLKEFIPDVDYWAVPPPKGHYGPAFAEKNDAQTIGDRFCITKDCKNKELAIKWLDFTMASEQGRRIYNFGREGLTYDMVNGKPQLRKDYSKIVKEANLVFRGGATMPMIYSGDARVQSYRLNFGDDVWERIANTANELSKYYHDSFPVSKTIRPEQLSTYEAYGEISSYVSDMSKKFVTGGESLSNFDSYVQKIKSMGIDDILKIRQEQYDSFIADVKR